MPCIMGGYPFKRALCDLGACVSLLPPFFSVKLNLGPVKQATTFIQLADRSVRTPVGMLENILVEVGG